MRDRAERLAQLRARERRQRRGRDDVRPAPRPPRAARHGCRAGCASRSRTPRAGRPQSLRRGRLPPRPPRGGPVVLEIVIPFESAKKRARFAIGIIPPCFRSRPLPFASEPRKPSGGLKSVALRARRRIEVGMVLRLTEHGDERRRDLERAGDLAEVERDVRADEVRAVGRLEAFAERPRPSARPAAARARCSRRRRSGRARSRSARGRVSRPRRAPRSTPSASSPSPS